MPEAADAGLLSPELAAGIRRVKGVRRLGVRLGNWLTPEQGRRLLTPRTPMTQRELRNHAMLAVLLGCDLRRGELLALPTRVRDALRISPRDSSRRLSIKRSRCRRRLADHLRSIRRAILDVLRAAEALQIDVADRNWRALLDALMPA